MSSTSSPVMPPSLLREGVSTWVATLVACLCAFMVVMDGAIVSVALPAMRDDLGLSAEQLQWVVDIYLLLLGGFMLLAARASDIYGRRNVLLWGLALFTGACLMGGLAQSGAVLLIARAVQGFGAAALATSPLAVIVAAHPRGASQDRAIGCWAACAAMGSAFGVVIGGVLTSLVDWRWVMFVNVPLGLILFVTVMFSLSPLHPDTPRDKLDMPGAITVTLSLASFLYAISQSVHAGWSDKIVFSAMVFALVMFLAFLVREVRAEQPLIQFGIFRLRNVPIGMVMVAGLGAILTASAFFLSLALQRIDGRNALETGLALLPMAVALAIAAMASRSLRDAGFTRLPLIGGLIAAAGLIWLYWLPMHPVYATELLLPTLLVGAGNGLVMMSATQAVLAGVPRQDSGLVAGLQNTSRQLGGAIGIAILASVAHGVTMTHLTAGEMLQVAELAGYHMAFLIAGLVSIVSALASLLLNRTSTSSS
ncbi:MFS transporter [Diaphorobacter ruginosibacter]|uniref:MFS transporter n=1 Tax=Diaphorobacter ruginosibacter TaxID=1715720 RepID=A0A7G9RJH5_9BURK|nr:MFS transporter [Diaphorobacter ruginosibacter]QNN55750.1 MFS transporter [Diaphorobacter ruginosibacter]